MNQEVNTQFSTLEVQKQKMKVTCGHEKQFYNRENKEIKIIHRF